MCEYKPDVILSAVWEQFFSLISLPSPPITQCLMVSFHSSRDRVVLTEEECTKHVTTSKLYKNKL